MPAADQTSCARQMRHFITPRNIGGGRLKSHRALPARWQFTRSDANKASYGFCRGYNLYNNLQTPKVSHAKYYICKQRPLLEIVFEAAGKPLGSFLPETSSCSAKSKSS